MAHKKENDNNNLLQKSLSTANTIKGAIKTGKTIAGAAKGATVLGPYGAVAGALWENKHLVIKIIIGSTILIMLPILFVLMLPSIIFEENPLVEGSHTQPILNNNQAIYDNINQISFFVSGLLEESLSEIEEEIEEDFKESEADQKEIIYPKEMNRMSQTNMFLSQYSAAYAMDYETINRYHLEKQLKREKKHLYSYTKTVEERDRSYTIESTGKSVTITELWNIYTINYNGENHFAQHIFKLTEEQMKLSTEYAYHLNVFLGEGLFQEMDTVGIIPEQSYEGIIFTDSLLPVVYFNQLDEQFADKPYGTDSIGGNGCGPTAMSIVVSSLTDQVIDPIEMSKWSYENGYWAKGSGSYHSLIPAAAKHWKLPVTGCSRSGEALIIEALSSGKLVVAIMSKGHFTSSGHFIVLRGITTEGKIIVADPGSYTRSKKEWDLSLILNEASKRAGAGGPFWIIG